MARLDTWLSWIFGWIGDLVGFGWVLLVQSIGQIWLGWDGDVVGFGELFNWRLGRINDLIGCGWRFG